MWLIHILLTPVLACEIISLFFFMMTQMIMRGIQRTEMPLGLHANIMFAMLIVMLVFYLPTLSVNVINAFFVSIVVFDKSTILSAISRFFRIAVPMFIYFVSYTLLMALSHIVIFIPSALTTPLTFILPKTLISRVFEFMLTIGLETLIYCFLAAAITIGGACLYRQLCAALEGQDILDKLKFMEAKP